MIKTLKLPVVKDDLQHHAVGCYTAESEIKKGNRNSEAALITAEKVAAIGSVAWGSHYPKAEFTSAWQRVLFLQFHDSLAGTSVPEHSQAAREGFGYATDIARHATYLSVQKLEWQVASEDPSSQYLLIFNPHAWEVNGNIEYDFNWDSRNTSRVEDEQGNSLAASVDSRLNRSRKPQKACCQYNAATFWLPADTTAQRRNCTCNKSGQC